ncbi:MAG: hypothetical protein Ct9H300mP28_28920 [Pseudomonadota bacterium]|nr:MAG: hypothetical protein Ct9H300mP28_28920 [Pseudomonadota bacterium]
MIKLPKEKPLLLLKFLLLLHNYVPGFLPDLNFLIIAKGEDG